LALLGLDAPVAVLFWPDVLQFDDTEKPPNEISPLMVTVVVELAPTNVMVDVERLELAEPTIHHWS
jgi:hypothetical protein